MDTMRACVAGAAVLVLPGCVNLSRTIEPPPIFPPPSQAVDISDAPKGANGDVCAKTRLLKSTVKPPDASEFAVSMVCAYNASDNAYWLPIFIDKGLALSDQQCEIFFRELDARRVETSYSQTNFNVLGTAVTAVLAAANHHQRVGSPGTELEFAL